MPANGRWDLIRRLKVKKVISVIVIKRSAVRIVITVAVNNADARPIAC